MHRRKSFCARGSAPNCMRLDHLRKGQLYAYISDNRLARCHPRHQLADLGPGPASGSIESARRGPAQGARLAHQESGQRRLLGKDPLDCRHQLGLFGLSGSQRRAIRGRSRQGTEKALAIPAKQAERRSSRGTVGLLDFRSGFLHSGPVGSSRPIVVVQDEARSRHEQGA